jgi:hypothetical protein
MVETMERRYGLAGRIWVMDRGMASAENPEVVEEHRAMLRDGHDPS